MARFSPSESVDRQSKSKVGRTGPQIGLGPRPVDPGPPFSTAVKSSASTKYKLASFAQTRWLTHRSLQPALAEENPDLKTCPPRTFFLPAQKRRRPTHPWPKADHQIYQQTWPAARFDGDPSDGAWGSAEDRLPTRLQCFHWQTGTAGFPCRRHIQPDLPRPAYEASRHEARTVI